MDTPVQPCLGIGLNPELAHDFEHSLPEAIHLDNLPAPEALAVMESESTGGLALVPVSTWMSLTAAQQVRMVSQQAWQRILIADRDASETLEFMSTGTFLALITLPLDEEKISRALSQAEEISTIYQDIFMMAREISLERELLARKNEQLAFLNQLLTRASQTLDPTVILSKCAEDFGLLLDVQAVLGVFWNNVDGHQEGELFIPNNISKKLQNDWINHLLTVGTRLGREQIQGYQVSFLPMDKNKEYGAPEREQLITQPLSVDGEPFGALIICSRDASTLGQDRLRILKSAANHLALAMRNSLEFRKTKARADHDGLTRISNRQHFDLRLREEMKRHQRHQDELSLMMVDLDYFKSVNDTYGHQAGDMVLKEVGHILQQTLRESDFPARYGGEEFVIILPQTRSEQAWILAERLRLQIGKTTFRHQNRQFRVTASIGIAGIKPGALAPPEELISHADQALYKAKNNGRNMVCCSSLEEPVTA